MLSELHAYILADTTISGLMGSRLYPYHIPQSSPYPCAKYFRVSSRPLNTHDSGGEDLSTDIVQIDLYSKTYAEAQALRNAFRARLNESDTIQGTIDWYIEWQGDQDGYETELTVHSISIDLLIIYTTTA